MVRTKARISARTAVHSYVPLGQTGPVRLPALPSLGSVAVLAVLAVVLALASCEGKDFDPDPAGEKRVQTAPVVRAVDGDTIEVRLAGAEEDVRYIGVDTPESVKPGAPVDCYALAASHFTERTVEGETVRLVFDRERRDVYGRLLAYVYLGDRFLNAELVRRGYARTLTIPPNDRHAERFARLERRAATAGRGLWGAC
jgi:micrococcal nuclease